MLRSLILWVPWVLYCPRCWRRVLPTERNGRAYCPLCGLLLSERQG